jgi:hypothetical protein
MDTPAPAPAAPLPPQSTDARGIPDPVLRVQAILNAEKAPEAPRAPNGQFTSAQQSAPTEQPSAQPDTSPEAEVPAGPNAQVEGEQAPAEDAQPTAEIPLDQLDAIELEMEYEAGGQKLKEKRSVKELREGFMRQQDYSKKTAEIARQREQLREETRKASEAERAKYVSELQTMHDLVLSTAEAELANVDWNTLSRDNAFEYVRLDNRRKEFTKTLESIKSKQAEVLSKHRTEQESARREMATKAITQLEQDIPGWNDTLYQNLMKAGIEKYGYKQEEVATWVDPRAFKLLHKANLYDQMQAEKKPAAPEKRVVAVPKVVRPGAAQQVNQAQLREVNSMKQLRTSGKIEDAAAVIKSRLRYENPPGLEQSARKAQEKFV